MAVNKLKSWKFLSPGDLIDVIAPASACPQQELSDGIKFLQEIGFRTRVAKDIFAPTPYLANTDKFRLAQVKKALLAKDSKGVWCIRGGYGANRLIPALLGIKPPVQPKLLLGLSDVTSLHIFLQDRWGWPTLHAPVLARMGSSKKDPREILSVVALVSGNVRVAEFGSLIPVNAVAKIFLKKKLKVRGKISGGNLITVQGSIGTAWQMNTKGKILFFEEVGERGYRIDRILVHMEQAGFFRNAKAVVLGDFLGGDEIDKKNYVNYAVTTFFETLAIPVFRGIPSGHGSLQLTVPLGTTGILEIESGKTARLIIPSGGS